MWRHLLDSTSSLGNKATLVAVDLPGYGGSDGCNKYSPDEVLEALTEFIVAMRDLYVEREAELDGHDEALAQRGQQVYLVGHDWGCVLAFRLASEAPGLADRFILTNGPLVGSTGPSPQIGQAQTPYYFAIPTNSIIGAPSPRQQRQYLGLIQKDFQYIPPGSARPLLMPP